MEEAIEQMLVPNITCVDGSIPNALLTNIVKPFLPVESTLWILQALAD